jgi:SAM-dependent methyltransferase
MDTGSGGIGTPFMSETAGPTATTIRHAHWEGVYRAKKEEELSWHQDDPRKAKSFALIREFAPLTARIIDIGCGSSTLAGALIDDGYSNVTVIDISEAALERAKSLNASASGRIRWIVSDVVASPVLPGPFDLWHDRAVFHFLTSQVDQKSYVDLCARNVAPGGHAVVATFALDGPEKCSGLPVQRYDGPGIEAAFQPGFELVKSDSQTHITPWGKPQAFCCSVLRRTLE